MTKEEMITRIDMVADTARASFVFDPVRTWEYKQAELDALSYQASNFIGDAPGHVAVWAEAANLSAKDAALDIITTAKKFNDVLLQIRLIRLKAKKAIEIETDEDVMQNLFDNAIAQLKYIQSLSS